MPLAKAGGWCGTVEGRHWVFCIFLPAPPQYWAPIASSDFPEALVHLFTHSLIAKYLLHSIPGAAQGAARSGEHQHNPQLFAGQGEGHKDVE